MRRFSLILVALLWTIALIFLIIDPKLLSLIKEHFNSPQHVAEFLRHQGWKAVLISLCLIVLNTLVPLVPFIILASANVLVFGLQQGFVISWFGAVVGAIAGYWIARLPGRNYFEARFAGNRFEQALRSKHNAFGLVFTARLIPFIPNSVVNYGAGISSISFVDYLWATLLGKLPIVAWESLLGNDLMDLHNHLPRLTVMLMLTGIFLIAIWLLYPKNK